MTTPYEGCPHYKRKATLLAPCCGNYVGCRFCHDEQYNEKEPDIKKAHTMDRHAVKTIKCMRCDLVPPLLTSGQEEGHAAWIAKGGPGRVQEAHQTCDNSTCQTVLGAYWCPVCVFLDDEITLADGTPKGHFHCDKCGICRVGGAENHTHCDKCGICVKTAGLESHTCALNATRTDCSVCLESLHASREPLQFLPCGHSLHMPCFASFLESGQRCCPLCKKMVVNKTYQHLLIDQIDQDIALAPMPDEYKDKRVRVRCNECRQESVTPFHVFGLKCQAPPLGEAPCGGSYNTVKIGEAPDAS